MSRETVGGIAVAMLSLLLPTGCSRQTTLEVPHQEIAAKQLPFDHKADASGHSPTAGMPAIVVPSGTWIRVHLNSSLSSSSAHPGDVIAATLDEPLVVRQQTLAPPGASVTGKVLVAKAAGGLQDPGYMRITLTAILLDGKLRELKTSSLFLKGTRDSVVLASDQARGPSGSLIAGGSNVEFSPARQLSFRLTDNLFLPD